MNRTYLITNWTVDFSCPGGDCGLTCCTADWKISLLDKEIENYRNLENDFRDIILQSIDFEKKALKCSNGKCNLLDENGYCEIVKRCGEEYLSYTCTIFPRRITNYGDVRELAVEIVCPAVAMNLLDEKDIEFYITEQDDGDIIEEVDFTLYNNLHQGRNAILEILQYMPGKYISGKMYIVLKIFDGIQRMIATGNIQENSIKAVLAPYQGKEKIDQYLQACEGIDFQINAKAKIVHKVLMRLYEKKILLVLTQQARVNFQFLGSYLQDWMNNGELLENDMVSFMKYMREIYPRFTEKFFSYVLFTSWCELDADRFGKAFIARIFENMLIMVCAMAIYKENKSLEKKEFAKLIATIDRVASHTDEKTLGEINAYYKSIGEDNFVNFLLMII